MRIHSLMMSMQRSRLTGPMALLVSRYGISVIGPLVSLLVVRYLGPYSYGLYASAGAVTALLSVLCDFGLQQAALEMGATARYPIGSVTRGMMRLGFLYTIVAYGAVALWVTLGGYEPAVIWLALLIGLGFLQTPLLTSVTVALQIQGRYERLALWNWVAAVVTWVGTVAAILADAGVYAIAGWPVLLGWLSTGLMLIWERKSLGLGPRRPRRSATVPLKLLFSRSWRFGTAGVMYQAYHRADAALLSLMRNPLEVGHYAVAFRIIELLSAFPGIVFNQVLYPKYFRWFAEARARVKQYYELTSRWMLMAGVVAAASTTVLGRDIVLLVFGSAQEPSAWYLGVMAWGLPAYYLAASAGALLTTGNQIDKKLEVQSLVAVLNVAMNAVLIPPYGAAASAVLMVITDGLLFSLYIVLVKQVQSLVPWSSLTQAVVGCALAIASLGVTLLVGSQGLAVRIGSVGVVLALAVSFWWFTLTSTERAELRRLVGRTETTP